MLNTKTKTGEIFIFSTSIFISTYEKQETIFLDVVQILRAKYIPTFNARNKWIIINLI